MPYYTNGEVAWGLTDRVARFYLNGAYLPWSDGWWIEEKLAGAWKEGRLGEFRRVETEQILRSHDLHRCADCIFWEPSLDWFGQPTGNGGCPFIRARNRKGERLRRCGSYSAAEKVEMKRRESRGRDAAG